MHAKKHKRKISHVVIVTSNAVDEKIRQFKLNPLVLEILVLLLCVMLGAVVGYLAYEERIWETAIQKNNEKAEQVERLIAEKYELQAAIAEQEEDYEAQIQSLNEKIQILSNTLDMKVQSESVLAAQLEKQVTPTEFPLNGPANIEEVEEGTPMCIFTSSAGSTIVATAAGTVMAVNDDVDYGHNIWIDHGNGYITIYRNAGDLNVKQGDSVVQGTTLFVIGDNNTSLGYQMMLDNEYINPMDVLIIEG